MATCFGRHGAKALLHGGSRSPSELVDAKALILEGKDIRQIVHAVGLNALMDEAIARLLQAFQSFDPNETIIPARTGFSYTEPLVGLIEWMPLLQKQVAVSVKTVGYHPQNPTECNLPTVLSTISAYDPLTGRMLGVMDATFLTALRTGAASAVASQFMAMPGSQSLGLIGCGAQAVSQLHAISRQFTLNQVWIYDTDPDVLASFSRRIARLNLTGLAITPCNLETLVARSDIICTATSVGVGEGPVFPDSNLKPWAHINAIGSDFPGKVEVPRSLLARAFVCPDFRIQAIAEGECQQLNPEDIGPELAEVTKNKVQYAKLPKSLTVFDSTGYALEDYVAMNLLLDRAIEFNVGTRVEIESIAPDVRDPYGFLFDPMEN